MIQKRKKKLKKLKKKIKVFLIIKRRKVNLKNKNQMKTKKVMNMIQKMMDK